MGAMDWGIPINVISLNERIFSSRKFRFSGRYLAPAERLFVALCLLIHRDSEGIGYLQQPLLASMVWKGGNLAQLLS